MWSFLCWGGYNFGGSVRRARTRSWLLWEVGRNVVFAGIESEDIAELLLCAERPY
jgi:hypothetical protein